MKVNKLILKFKIPFAIVSAVLNIIILIIPIISIKGIVNGNIALLWYNLSYYGKELKVPFYDSIILKSIPLLASSIFLLIMSIIYARKKVKTTNIRSLFIASILIQIISMTTPIPLINYSIREAFTYLKVDYNFVTSGGQVFLGSSSITILTFAQFLLIPSIVCTILLAGIVLSEEIFEREKEVETKKIVLEEPIIARALEKENE